MFDDQVIFVTGGTGSWGHELITQLLESHKPKEVRIYSRGEHKQVDMKSRFGNNPRLKFIIGDVRDKNILNLAMKDVDYVFHLAALKHVPICEENPWEAVLTNIYGTQNVIECAMANNVKKVIDISTDKAVDPFNHYGVTKACGEKLIINANQNYQSNTKFVCIRGGNVMGTNGSVLPLFASQISNGNIITVTDPEMTRYLMSTHEAISLVFKALLKARGGEIFVMRMPATTVSNIVHVMSKLLGNNQTKQKVIGKRPGEKMHEILVSKNEATRTKVLDQKYYVILPQFNDAELEETYKSYKYMEEEEFNSENAVRLKNEEFAQILASEKWLKLYTMDNKMPLKKITSKL